MGRRGPAGTSSLPPCYNYTCSSQRWVACWDGAVAFPVCALCLGVRERGSARGTRLRQCGEGKGSGCCSRPPTSCVWARSCIGSIQLRVCWRSPGSWSCLKIVTDNKPLWFMGQFGLGTAGCCRSRWQQCLAARVGQCHASVSPSMTKPPCAGEGGGVHQLEHHGVPTPRSHLLVLLGVHYQWTQK